MLTKEQSYSFPPSTTFPEQLKFSLCFWPICKSRYSIFSKTFPHTHCKAGSFIDLRCASFAAGSVEVSSFEVEATPVCDLVLVIDLVLICDGAVAMVVVVVVMVVTVVDDSPVVAVVTVSDFDFLGEAHSLFEKEENAFGNALLLLYHPVAMEHLQSFQFQQCQF